MSGKVSATEDQSTKDAIPTAVFIVRHAQLLRHLTTLQ